MMLAKEQLKAFFGLVENRFEEFSTCVDIIYDIASSYSEILEHIQESKRPTASKVWKTTAFKKAESKRQALQQAFDELQANLAVLRWSVSTNPKDTHDQISRIIKQFSEALQREGVKPTWKSGADGEDGETFAFEHDEESVTPEKHRPREQNPVDTSDVQGGLRCSEDSTNSDCWAPQPDLRPSEVLKEPKYCTLQSIQNA